jgi:hypothetical protein
MVEKDRGVRAMTAHQVKGYSHKRSGGKNMKQRKARLIAKARW